MPSLNTAVQSHDKSPRLCNKARKNKIYADWKTEIKLSLFTDMLLYMENTKQSILKLLEIIKEFSKVARY